MKEEVQNYKFWKDLTMNDLNLRTPSVAQTLMTFHTDSQQENCRLVRASKWLM